jgi:hypothetical protein
VNAHDLVLMLDARRNGSGWRAKCPAHDDSDPSLDIAERDGKTLVKCRAGCSQEAVLDALRARGLWPDHRANDVDGVLAHPPLGAPHATFEYHDAAGKLLGVVCRWNTAKGKEVRPAIRNGNGWLWKAFSTPRPLYRLPDLAAHTDKPVLMVEGEKAADAAREIIQDYVVTTWPGGTGAVAHVDLAPLKGRDVVLWPDNDDAGRKAMRAIADRLTDARSVRGVKLPDGLPAGWDLADAIPAELDPVGLIAAAIDVRKDRLTELPVRKAADLMEREFKEPKWGVPNVIPEGCSILAGRPKSGKSWLALGIAVSVASGGPAMGNIECDQGDVLAILLEDTDRRLQGRLRAVLQGASCPKRLDYATEWKRADAGGLEDIRAWLSARPEARLVVVDTLEKIRGKRSSDQGVYADDYAAVAALKAIADQFGVAILLIHHQRKEGGDDPINTVSGTAGITGAADTILVLKRELGDPNAFLYVRGRDVHEQELALEFDTATGRWTHISSGHEFKMSQERKAILSLLREAGEQMNPKRIASELGKSRAAVRMLLKKMASAGEILRNAKGEYSAS